MNEELNSNEIPIWDQSFRDHLTTISEDGKSKYIKPTKPKGKWFNRRAILAVLYYAAFFTVPFIKVNGRPLLLFDFFNGKFILFSKAFWPQDFFVFGVIMLAAILFIAIFTVAYGRIFCGWICPQTIFLEMLFRRVDFMVLGTPANHRKWVNAPMSAKKFGIFSLRYGIYFILSFIIANTFLSYLIGVDELIKIITEPVSMHIAGFIGIIVFTFVFFGVYVFLREQVCTNICPYGRMQSVLLDKHSIVVAYDYGRGEPRGKFKKDQGDLGDCIDCFQCVNVCPTGIDIRNGTQLECVNCTACIDACDFMMEKTGRPKGLIRYDSEYNIANKKAFTFTRRLKLYSAALIVLLTAIVTLLATRSNITGQILRTSGLLYQEKGTDSISNLYSIKIINKTLTDRKLNLKLEEKEGSVQFVGKPYIDSKADDYSTATFFVVLPKREVKERKNPIKVGLYENGEKIKTLKTNFLGPISSLD
ncbi:MAG: cytochrome c oxidase accessory protein CcoG [Bacteroidetes bacterium]|nr:cytochrome c oxidase accessory protein CcoG [Bacteroidota bacterium]